jgi:hypothetical protein
MYLTNVKRAAIARALGLDRETVVRILSQEEILLVEGYRDAVLKTQADTGNRKRRTKWASPHKKRGQSAHYPSEKSAKISQTEA